MLVAVLKGEGQAYYHNLVRLAPIQFIAPPVAYLTKPEESTSRELINRLDDENSSLLVTMKAVQFKNLYNINSGLPGFFTALVPENIGSTMVRKKLQVMQADDPFIFNAMLCVDGMRSSSVRSFCKSMSDAFYGKYFDWEVFHADENNPDHKTLFENYNSKAQEIFLSGPAGASL